MSNENTNHPEPDKDTKRDFDESAMDENFDDSKMKFITNGGDDSHVVVDVGSEGESSFTGLGKEELMKYAKDPFWVRTRMILFVLFWVGWFAMLVAAILIIVFAPKCPERPNLKWYQKDVMYQIQPKSFKDTSGKDTEGAGIGDIPGIQGKVEYLQSLGVNTLWINSIFESGGLYDGNDVVNHMAVDPVLGGMGAFDRLRKNTKKKGMKIVLDFLPNYTGKKHEWFTKSENNDPDYADYYIWAGTDKTQPPNNWQTEYGTRAWTYSETRKQWYYHSSLPEYPDLNLRNGTVLNELDGIMKFWLEKGVDGFAVQGLQYLVEHNETTQDETVTGEYTVDRPENLDLVKRWKAIVDSFSDKPGRERVLIGSVVSKGNNTSDYNKAGISIVLSDALIGLNPGSCSQTCFENKLNEATDGNGRRGWMLDNENSGRFGSLLDEAQQKAFQVLHFLLPGTPIVYYGDEIAMTNGNVAGTSIRDPLANLSGSGRDNYRTPMLWNNMPNAGFCPEGVNPWLPVNNDYMSRSVEYNNAHLLPYTVLHSFKDLVQLRSNEAFQFGTFDIKTLGDDILYFTRTATGFPSYLVVINRGAKTVGFSDIAESMTLVYDSEGSGKIGTTYNLKEAPIGFDNGEIYVFRY